VDNFRGVAAVKLGNGGSFLFWSDNWIVNNDKIPMMNRFPRLFSYALNVNIAAREVYLAEDLTDLFYLPLSEMAYHELMDLKQIMLDNPVSVQSDAWSYVWGPTYTAALFYKRIHAHIKTPSVYKWLWKSCCMMRHKMFAWLVLSDRVNTRDLLQRRHWHVTDDTHYELCPGHLYEDRAHLFFECQFST
jgi:hypothetical protein